LNKRLVCLLYDDYYYCRLFFYKACYNVSFKCEKLLHRKSQEFNYNLDVSKVRLVSFMCVKIRKIRVHGDMLKIYWPIKFSSHKMFK